MLLAACTASGGGGSISGPVKGKTPSIVDVVSGTYGTSTDGFAAIYMASATNICHDPATPDVQHPFEQTIIIQLADVTSTTSAAPTAPGTYTIAPSSGTSPPKSALFEVNFLDAACVNNADNSVASSGTVTLTSVTSDVFAGSYDVMMSSGEHVTGSFTPEACSTLSAQNHSGLPPTCE